MTRLLTWAGRSSFNYEGSIITGTVIHYGKGYKAFISENKYIELVEHFKGRIANIGTSHDNPPPGSVGDWLMNNVNKVSLASYVGSILIYEGYAEKLGGPDLKFFG